ncbi:MAG: ImmA/IrrE family metallo-endopeptidase [Casimicrobiaceae bacterium]
MNWTRDNSGRFHQRPHYSDSELEQICEDAICGFLRERHGKATFPVRTADLTVLIENTVDDLDNGCDLEEGIDGLTDFFPKKKPKVKIATRLQQPYLENRLRTTLTHEYGHVILHGFLFAIEGDLKKLFDGKAKDTRNTCHRDHMHGGSPDWMEWQAGFACGALLMPRTELLRVVKAFREAEDKKFTDIGVNSDAGKRLIQRVMADFQVSQDAARVRLEQRKVITKNPVVGLFG